MTLFSHYQIPKRLIKKILGLAEIHEDHACAHLSAQKRSLLITLCTGF
jgi:hypothetical protein